MRLNCFTVLFTLWTAQLLIYVVKGRTFYLVFYCLSLNRSDNWFFLYPLKTSKTCYFLCFQGVQKEISDMKSVKKAALKVCSNCTVMNPFDYSDVDESSISKNISS